MAGTFWSGQAEPRRNFKFLLSIGPDLSTLIPVWVIKSVNLPEISVGESEHKFLNHTFYFPGTVTYNEISFTLVDAIEENISNNILQQFGNSGYNIPSNPVAAQTSLMTKEASVGALGDVRIEHLGSDSEGQTNKIIFVLNNAWIKKVQFGQSLAYNSEDLSEISVTLKYDFFTFEGGDPVGFTG